MTLLVKDNFSEKAESIRKSVIAEGFGDEVGPDGFNYTGINKSERPELVDKVGGFVEEFDMKMSFFRLNLQGEMPHSYVHSDEICADWAGLLYLNPVETSRGGTAFWRHKQMKWDRVPDNDEVEALGLSQEEFGEQLSEDWKKQELWEMSGFIGMKFNRFLVYPTKVFHSRYPHEGFGQDGNDGRLVWVCFFDGQINYSE